MEVNGQLHILAPLTYGKIPRDPLDRRLRRGAGGGEAVDSETFLPMFRI
jgi:hypothetical protein